MRGLSHFQGKEPIFEEFLRRLRYQKIINHIDKDTVVLDLGCGYQLKLLDLISNKIWKGVGIDIVTLKKGLPKNISSINIDLDEKKIPSKSNYFDYVVSTALIEHLNNPKDLILETFRVLKKGGVLLLTTPSKISKPILEFLSFNLGIISKKEIADHKNYFDKKSMTLLLANAGFKRKNIQISYFQLGFNVFVKAIK